MSKGSAAISVVRRRQLHLLCDQTYRGGVRAPFGRAPSPENVFIFYLNMVSFGAFWVALPRCMLFRATAQETEAGEEGRERAQVKDDILH